ncbi:MAG: hypothetical protein LBT20_00065 [Clostridiales bacterium]|nr:hypothetical protein [Clostridiales bacterium]
MQNAECKMQNAKCRIADLNVGATASVARNPYQNVGDDAFIVPYPYQNVGATASVARVILNLRRI